MHLEICSTQKTLSLLTVIFRSMAIILKFLRNLIYSNRLAHCRNSLLTFKYFSSMTESEYVYVCAQLHIIFTV